MSATPPSPTTPAQAWSSLRDGNQRFVSGVRLHPHQDVERRTALAAAQRPNAVFFGCADSRVAAEIIFDQGLGDLFVVRTAGHVVDSAVLGSIEFAVAALSVPLIVVLGHDSCGAVKATMEAVSGGEVPTGFVRDIVERVTPSVLAAHRAGKRSAEEVEGEHVRATIRLLTERSSLVSSAIAQGTLGIVGAQYALDEGRARVLEAVGPVEATVGIPGP